MQEHFGHYTVLLDETVDGLNMKPDGIYVDCTLGGAGHSSLIASRLSAKGRLIGIDRDPFALEKAAARLEPYQNRVTLLRGNFAEAPTLLRDNGIEHIDGVIADLGVSSFQLDEPERGFSYMHDAPLDMRMSPDDTLDAHTVVNTYDERKLAGIIELYGEERFAKRIASFIVKHREIKPIETTFELSDIIKDAIPAKNRADGPHPAKRTFQAIRIEVNGELDAAAKMIEGLFPMLNKGGRMAIISFHSLEDRIVKHAYTNFAAPCVCPPDFPVCTCGRKPTGSIITKKPILPSDKELEENPRSRSAKLRICEKI